MDTGSDRSEQSLNIIFIMRKTVIKGWKAIYKLKFQVVQCCAGDKVRVIFIRWNLSFKVNYRVSARSSYLSKYVLFGRSKEGSPWSP